MAQPLQKLTTFTLIIITLGAANGGKVPDIPSGRRTQYYFLLDNGGYKYGYDTGSGSSEKAYSNEANEVKGVYSYISPSGPVSVKYTSGVGGYRPEGLEKGFLTPHVYGQGYQQYHQTAYNFGGRAGTYSQAQNLGDSSFQQNSDDGGGGAGISKAYAFSYNAADHSRHEASDSEGNVVGSFSFIPKDDGITRTVNYEAGADKGFVAKGAHIPSDSKTGLTAYGASQYSSSQQYLTPHLGAPAVSGGSVDGSYSFSYNAGDHTRQESSDSRGNVKGSFTFVPPDDGKLRAVVYDAGAEKGFTAVGSHLPSAQAAPSSASYLPPASTYSVNENGDYAGIGGRRDKSYSFSYQANDHSRHESSDSQGNVVGSFSFIPKDDGQLRTVDYQAGSTTGFVAKGRHIPTDTSLKTYSPTLKYDSAISQFGQTSGLPTSQTSGVYQDGSYSFSYNAGDHTRQESSDSKGNVQGGFTFIPKDDGILRKVDYSAGEEKGFQAFGSHLPTSPTGTSVSTISGHSFSIPQIATPRGTYSTGSPSNDGSYSFSYNAGDHSRLESGDSQGNVRGSFSFVAKNDGISRKVDYEAGAEKGFIAKGAHLPKQSEVPTTPTQYISAEGTGGYSSTFQPGVNGQSSLSQQTSTGGDASYSFSYNSGDHTRQETADAQGNVVGSFSFVAKDDGKTRRVDYAAGAGRGFTAHGSHLPKQPTVATNPLDSNIINITPTPYSGADLYLTVSEKPVFQPYSFSYNAGDHSRQESSDASGSVRGSYSFVAGNDGIPKTVVYEAGPEKGFVAKGAHLPKPVEPTSGAAHQGSSASFGGYAHSADFRGGTHFGASQVHSVGNLKVKTLLVPNSHRKVGYVFDTR